MSLPFSIDQILRDFGVQLTKDDRLTIEVFDTLLMVNVKKVQLNADITVRLKIKGAEVVTADFSKQERNTLIYKMLKEKYSRVRIQNMLGIKNTIIDSALAKTRS